MSARMNGNDAKVARLEWVRDNANNFTCAVYSNSEMFKTIIASKDNLNFLWWKRKRFYFKWDSSLRSEIRCQKGTKTDKTSEFTLLNVDSEVYPQSSMPESVKIKLNAIWLGNFDQSQFCRSIQICKFARSFLKHWFGRYKCFCGS